MTDSIKPKTLLQNIINRIFCIHDYSLINHYEIKSEFDIVKDSGKTPNTHCSLKRKYIWDYKCNKCQKLKRLNETTC
jgi:hypothetical protein